MFLLLIVSDAINAITSSVPLIIVMFKLLIYNDILLGNFL